MDAEQLGEPEREGERGVWGYLFIIHARVGISGGIGSAFVEGEWVYTSPPGFSSSWPRPGMGRVNVQGSFWASVKIASME